MKKCFYLFFFSFVAVMCFACDYELQCEESSMYDFSNCSSETINISISDTESEVFLEESLPADDRLFVIPPTITSDFFDYKYGFSYGDTVVWSTDFIERYIKIHITESNNCAALCLVKLEDVQEDIEDDLRYPFLEISIIEVFEASASCCLQKGACLRGKGDFSIIKNVQSESIELRCSKADLVMNDIGSYYIAYVSYHGDETIDMKERIYDIQAWSLPINSKTIYDQEYYDQLCNIMCVRRDVLFRSELLIEKYCRFPDNKT